MKQPSLNYLKKNGGMLGVIFVGIWVFILSFSPIIGAISNALFASQETALSKKPEPGCNLMPDGIKICDEKAIIVHIPKTRNSK